MFEKLLERLAGALDAARIAYMIIGGQAVLLPQVDLTYVRSVLEEFAATTNEPLVDRLEQVLNPPRR